MGRIKTRLAARYLAGEMAYELGPMYDVRFRRGAVVTTLVQQPVPFWRRVLGVIGL